MTSRAGREEVRRNHARRLADRAARVERVRALWPTMAVRDIAVEVDITAEAVLSIARKAGLPSRPIAAIPGGLNAF